MHRFINMSSPIFGPSILEQTRFVDGVLIDVISHENLLYKFTVNDRKNNLITVGVGYFVNSDIENLKKTLSD